MPYLVTTLKILSAIYVAKSNMDIFSVSTVYLFKQCICFSNLCFILIIISNDHCSNINAYSQVKLSNAKL